ncbi:MAG: valine--tRNA ligase [Chlamydiales bacterium]|nr:valine--tRNA ligase [Chlamydiales bacterium]
MDKAYDPKKTEQKWASFWDEKKLFQADATSSKPPFCIVMPPPNVTGVLHMGHALVSTLQDILTRWKRMSGFEALWLPGTDHAGIATQTVVERNLLKEGKRRSDFTREEFLEKVWAWKEKSESVILSQLRQMGCSCDWSRLRFTMDEGCSKAVYQEFKRLFDKGLIYRGDYLVNWDPVTMTALADDEVEYEERDSYLWYMKYHLADMSGFVHFATTRPETMLGDTAIAVSPKDKRYAHLVGKKVRLPFDNREIPIIADRHVDPEFGTGVVKITPAHDPNDYRMGIDHDLPMINILTPDGRINENGGQFEGMSREEARNAIVEHMKKVGLLEKVERHTNRVGVSYRSKAVIEPLLSKQWFVKMEPFKEKLLNTKVKILPPSWERTYNHWIENLRDWCISRQLWWGHRIPVWYKDDEMVCSDTSPGEGWEQDPDVLDTWFSSALWPFSTLGWPDNSADLAKFYPNSVLITGHDILFFWVARMIMMGEETLGEAPFAETFLHGLIYGKSYWRDNPEGGITYVTGEEKKEYDKGKPLAKDVKSKWEKLSKSKGNVIDPLEMIAEYGTDAVRMSLCSCANQSPQIDLDRRRFEEFKNFANKVWNGARFVFMHLEDLEIDRGIDYDALKLEDHWILSAINRINKQVNESLANYQFDQAATASYDFFWKEFCASYVEICKPTLFKGDKKNKQKILLVILCNMLRLLHPMAPFITEELFQNLKRFAGTCDDPYLGPALEALKAESCAIAPYPTVINESDIHPEIEEQFALMEEVVYTVRNIRGEMKIPPQIAIDIYIVGDIETSILSALVKTNKVEIVSEAPDFSFAATGAVGDLKIIIPLPQELATLEKERLCKEKDKVQKALDQLRALLNNQGFLERAQPELVEEKKQALSQLERELVTIESKLRLS